MNGNSPNFLVRKFYGKAQFPQIFGWFAQNYAETLPFHKISKPGKKAKIQYKALPPSRRKTVATAL